MTRKEQEASAARHAEEKVARNAGRDYFEKRPDLMLVEVHRYASKLYEQHYLPGAFAEGYQSARRQHDEYLAEKRAAEQGRADQWSKDANHDCDDRNNS